MSFDSQQTSVFKRMRWMGALTHVPTDPGTWYRFAASRVRTVDLTPLATEMQEPGPAPVANSLRWQRTVRGLTLVHFAAQRKHLFWDCGMSWVTKLYETGVLG